MYDLLAWLITISLSLRKICPLCLFLNPLFGHCVLTHTRCWVSAHCDVAEYWHHNARSQGFAPPSETTLFSPRFCPITNMWKVQERSPTLIHNALTTHTLDNSSNTDNHPVASFTVSQRNVVTLGLKKSTSVASWVKYVKHVYGFRDFFSLLKQCCCIVQSVFGLPLNLKEKKNSHKIVLSITVLSWAANSWQMCGSLFCHLVGLSAAKFSCLKQ